MDMEGFNLTVNSLLTLPTGTSVTQDGGTLSYGSITPTLGSGGTINP